jgi:hypothetical protein
MLGQSTREPEFFLVKMRRVVQYTQSESSRTSNFVVVSTYRKLCREEQNLVV